MKNSVIRNAVEKTIKETGYIRKYWKFVSITGSELIKYNDYESIPEVNIREFSTLPFKEYGNEKFKSFNPEANWKIINSHSKKETPVFSPEDDVQYGSLVYNLKLVMKYVSKKKSDVFEYTIIDKCMKIKKNGELVAYLMPILFTGTIKEKINKEA